MRFLVPALAVALAQLPAPAWAQAAIGSTAISTNQVSARLGAQERALRRGDPVHQDEAVRTGAASAAQLLFRDETTMNLGANTEIVLDRMAYDPNRKSGEVVVRAVSGAFRFASGSLNPTAYQVRTPAGNIGVRGTMFFCNLAGISMFCNVTEGSILFCDLLGTCTTVNAGSTLFTNGTVTQTARDCGPSCAPNFANSDAANDATLRETQLNQRLDTLREGRLPRIRIRIR
jgi:ferric-dicitrate binding protein FerR (iron transport regulator)